MKNGYITIDDIMRIYLSGLRNIIRETINSIQKKVGNFFGSKNVRETLQNDKIPSLIDYKTFIDVSQKFGLSLKESIFLFYTLKIGNTINFEDFIQEIHYCLKESKTQNKCMNVIEKVLKYIIENKIDRTELISRLSENNLKEGKISAKSFELCLIKMKIELNKSEIDIFLNHFDIFHSKSFNIYSIADCLYKMIDCNNIQSTINNESKQKEEKKIKNSKPLNNNNSREELSSKCREFFDDESLKEKLCEYYYKEFKKNGRKKIFDIAFFITKQNKNNVSEKDNINVISNYLSLFAYSIKELLFTDEFSMFLTFIGVNIKKYKLDNEKPAPVQINTKPLDNKNEEKKEDNKIESDEFYKDPTKYKFSSKDYFKKSSTIFNSFEAAIAYCESNYQVLIKNKNNTYQDPDFGPQSNDQKDDQKRKSLYWSGYPPEKSRLK